MAHPAPRTEFARCPLSRRLAVLAAACAGLAGPLSAQEGITNLPAPTSATSADTSADYFWWAERFDRVRFSMFSTTHYFVNDPQVADTYCYLPPLPPPLDAEVPLFGTPLPTGPAAHARLAQHINDPFYPMLGSALSAGPLSRPLLAQLDAYQDAKAALQQQLRARLAELKDADATTRERQLAALAEAQAPRFATLEAQGEKLRAELQRLFPLGGTRDAMHPAAAVPSAENPGAYVPGPQELEADALQLAAFYQDGLSADQRRLLRETSAALFFGARDRPVEPGAANRWLFFSPEMARLRLPETLPALVEKAVAGYTTLKGELARELRDVLRDRTLSSGARTDALKQLAGAQASRLAALQALAEDIRRGLAARPESEDRAVAPALPAELATRISDYRRHKDEALKTIHAMLTSPQKGPVAEFNRAQAALADGLNKENAEIRVAVGNHVRGLGRAGDRKSIDDLLREFENARQQQESEARFRDYRTAMLLPGLSPDQRRVLFDAAVTQLGLPLPAGQRIR